VGETKITDSPHHRVSSFPISGTSFSIYWNKTKENSNAESVTSQSPGLCFDNPGNKTEENSNAEGVTSQSPGLCFDNPGNKTEEDANSEGVAPVHFEWHSQYSVLRNSFGVRISKTSFSQGSQSATLGFGIQRLRRKPGSVFVISTPRCKLGSGFIISMPRRIPS
jgi:hypothetical protein